MIAILSAVFFTILLVAGNTMAQAVRERRAELGALKAIGFTGAQLLGLVLAESMTLSGLGGAAGLGLAWALISRGDPTGGTLPFFHLPVENLLSGVGFILALALISGLGASYSKLLWLNTPRSLWDGCKDELFRPLVSASGGRDALRLLHIACAGGGGCGLSRKRWRGGCAGRDALHRGCSAMP